MRQYLKYLKGDSVVWVISVLMLTFSLVTVYSFVPILIKIEGGSPFNYLYKHFIYVLLAFLSMYWVHTRNPKYVFKLAKFIYVIAVILLIFTMFFGLKVNDAGRWIRIPFINLTFQSSDFAKLALIIYLSRLLDAKKAVLNQWKEGVLPLLLPIVIICGLIVKDNFSTAAILFSISLALLFVGRVQFKKIAVIIASVVFALFLVIVIHKAIPSMNLLPRYQTWENRWLNHDGESVITNAQALNARLAIHNGSLLGQGVGGGELKEFIPEAYADFYYASFVEEFGLICAFFLILLYLILLFRIFKIGLNTENLFQTYVCVGIGMLILSQVSVNMLVCTGVFPVTGQNMPLLAMGGSALIMVSVSIGLVQSIGRSNKNQSEDINKF